MMLASVIAIEDSSRKLVSTREAIADAVGNDDLAAEILECLTTSDAKGFHMNRAEVFDIVELTVPPHA